MAELNPKEFEFEDETDLKAVLADPRRWYPLYFLLLLVGIIVAGVNYLNQMNDINKNYVNSLVFVEEKEAEDTFMEELATENMIKASEEINKDVKSKVEMVKNSSIANDLNGVVHCKMRMANSLASNKTWIDDYNIFKRMLIDNVPTNGFTSNITEVSNEKLVEMHGVLASIFK